MSAAVMAVLAGCATTTGGDQFQNTVYDMHRRVVKLENTLEGTMTQLNETTATLTARVGENDEQTRRIGSLLEENQARLDGIAQELSEFKSTLYRRWGEPGASGPAVGSSPEVTTGTPTIEVPSTVTPTETTQSVVVAPPPAPPAPAASGDHQTAYQRAQKAWIDEDYNQALELFSEYLTQYPNNDAELSANALFWRAYSYLKLEQHQNAIDEFEKVRAQYPSSSKAPSAMHNEAIAYARLGQRDKAEALLQEVVTNYPATTYAEEARRTLEKLRGNS